MTDTLVHVHVGMDSETDEPYVYAADGPDDGEGPNDFVFPIDAALWATYAAALHAWHQAEAAIIATTPFNPDTGRLEECCATWTGILIPGHTGWRVVLAASGNDHEWPLHDHAVAYESSYESAQGVIEVLPDEFYVHLVGQHFQKVPKANLTLAREEYKGYANRCHNCGWERTDHPDTGQPIIIDMPQADADEETAGA